MNNNLSDQDDIYRISKKMAKSETNESMVAHGLPVNSGDDGSWDDMFSHLKDITNNSTSVERNQMLAYSISENDTLEQMKFNTEQETTEINPDLHCSCGGEFKIKHNTMMCHSCGLEMQHVITSTQEDEMVSSSGDANVNDKGFISMRIVGKGSYKYNRGLLKDCANYSRYCIMLSLKEMNNWNAQSTSVFLPKNVIEFANTMFAAIKKHNFVFRKDVKKGVQAACLYYACHMNHISRTPAEIAKIVGIAEKFLSSGDRYLRDFNERGIINIPMHIDIIDNYIERYFELLKLPNVYKKFVYDIITQAENDHLHVRFDSKNNTKCIGTIYLLVDRVPFLNATISKERIEKECDISRTTFIKYYNMLCSYYRRFTHIFVKYKIPMKSIWRDKIWPSGKKKK